jgi:tetratricopeptide (TPR) repeat protein
VAPGGLDLPVDMGWRRGETVEAPPQPGAETERQPATEADRLRLPWEVSAEGVSSSPPAPGVASPQVAPTGADLYQDLVNAYLSASGLEQVESEKQPATLTTPAQESPHQRDVTVLREMLERPVLTFAGSADAPVQNLIRQAEALAREGKYYEAKATYEQAMIYDRHNPLLLLGQGHAMLAAGEYYSAALALSRAVELFNAIAYLRFDLRSFITEPDVLEMRRADLEQRLEKEEDYRLRFVLGYTEYYSDLAKYGLPNLKLAAEQAPEHSGIARLHDLLARQRPREPG